MSGDSHRRQPVGRLSINTVYFGGGTPSLLPPEMIGEILHSLSSAFHILPESEITLEANPGHS